MPDLSQEEYLDTIMDAQEFVTDFLLNAFEKDKKK